MDDLLGHLDTIFWAFLGRLATFFLEATDAANRKAVELLSRLADAVNRLAAKLAAVPLWVSLPAMLLLIGLAAAYVFRQRLYDRVLVYHLVWLRKQGFSRHVFRICRGAVRETRQAMARQVPLSGRFRSIAVYEVQPDRYAVAFGVDGEVLEDLRLYRRDLRTGLAAMAADLTAYYRANVRLLHADSEVRALFALLDAADPDFAAARPALPGEVKPEEDSGITLPSRRGPNHGRLGL